MKHYSDGSRTHIDGSSAQLRRIYKGVDTKFLSAAYVDFIKIKSGEKMTSMALDGLNLSAKYRDETLSNGYTIKPYNAITYFDNSNGVGLLQDNYTFFGFENGISYIKPTESSKAYYSMPAEMPNCQDFLPMPFKEDLSSSHLLDNQMSYLAFGSNQVQFAKTYGSNNKKYTKVLSCKVNSIAFDEDWLSTLSYYKYGPDTEGIPLSDFNPISVWTKGVYYFTDDGIYKNLFGVIQSNRDIREDGVPIEEYAGPRWAGVETKMLSAAPLTLYTKNLSSQLSVDNAAKKIFSGGYAYVSGTNYFEYNKEAWRFIPNGLNGTLECRSGSRLSAIGTSPTTGWSPLLIGITDADVAGGTAFTVNGSKVVVYPNFSSASTGTSITFESETADTLNHVYAIDCGNSDVFGIIFGTKSVEYVTKEGRTVLSSNVGTINSVYEMNLGYTKKWYAKTGSSIFETSLSSYNAGSASEPVIRHIPVL